MTTPLNIIETMFTIGTPTGIGSASFTVDNTVNQVKLVIPAISGAIMFNANGKKTFQAGDSFTILSMGAMFPFSFSTAFSYDNPTYPNPLNPQNHFQFPIILLTATNSVGANVVLPGLENGEIGLPFLNYELSIGQFIDSTEIENAGKPDSFYISATFNRTIVFVSMIGVPNSLNGLVLTVPIFIKIQHNFPLSA